MIITLEVKPPAVDAISRAVASIPWPDDTDARVARHYLQAIVGQAVILRGHRSPEALDAIRDYWSLKNPNPSRSHESRHYRPH